MSKKNVSDALWEMLADAGVKRCYGIVGDAMNPIIDGLRRNGKIEFIHVRHEEAGVFAASAEGNLTGEPVAVCGTAGPGVTHLINGLIDARKEGAPVIAVAGDTVSSVIDTGMLEELNPYAFFSVASRYTGRIVNPQQTRAVVQTAIRVAIAENGPTVIAIPGDVAAQAAPDHSFQSVRFKTPVLRPSEADLGELAKAINGAKKVTIFGGAGCEKAHDEVVELATKLKAPVGYAYRGKQWLEWENPNAVGMSGLIGWGGAYDAMHEADLLLLLGTDFPFSDFYPTKDITKVQIDKSPAHLGRRTNLDMALVGHVKDTVEALLPLVEEKADSKHLDKALEKTEKSREKMARYVTHGPDTKPLRPEYLTSTINEVADDNAIFSADTGTPCIWMARYIHGMRNRRLIGSLSWASMANAMSNAMGAALSHPGRQCIALCGDGGFTMMMGDLLTIVERNLPVKVVIFDNGKLDFVHIEQEEAGLEPFGTEFKNPNFQKVAEAMGAFSVRIEDPKDVPDGVRAALSHDGPAVIDAVVDPLALSLPPHITFGMAEGFSLSLAKQALAGRLDDVLETGVRNVRLT